jgi:hypothetical protein
MFPELSEKAWGEIDRIRWDDTQDHGVDAFRELFNLKRYPITPKNLFRWLKDNPEFEDYKVTYASASTEDSFNFYPKNCNKMSFLHDPEGTSYEDISDILHDLREYCKCFDVDLIVVFGEIHGWWEKEIRHDS